MWDHFLRLGGNEIANSARAYGYATSGGCSAHWLVDREWGGVTDMLNDAPYDIERIADAPWYDFRSEVTSRFYGIYVVSVTGLTGSTAFGSAQEGVTEGGVAGRVRRAGRSVRVRAWLTGRGRDAVDAGESWLDSVLSGKGCGMHRDSCGASDMLFLSGPPEEMDSMESVEDYEARLERQYRYLHEVTRVSGPIPVQERASSDGMHYGRLVEFTVYAGVPRILGQPRRVSLQPTLPVVVQDIPYNNLPFPSAELVATPDYDLKAQPNWTRGLPACQFEDSWDCYWDASQRGDGSGRSFINVKGVTIYADEVPVIVARNLSPNPSLMNNPDHWAASVAAVSGSSPAPFFTNERSADLAAEGAFSLRGRILGDGSTASGRARITVFHDVSVAEAGSRISFSVWGAALNLLGAAGNLQSIRAEVEWRNSSGTSLATTAIGATRTAAADFNGRVFSIASVNKPSGATTARVKMICETLWASSSDPNVNSDIRVYMDAVGVTIP